jgi:hypothetical protein
LYSFFAISIFKSAAIFFVRWRIPYLISYTKKMHIPIPQMVTPIAIPTIAPVDNPQPPVFVSIVTDSDVDPYVTSLTKKAQLFDGAETVKKDPVKEVYPATKMIPELVPGGSESTR